MRARHRHFNPRGLGAKLVLDARYIDQADNTAVSTWSDRSGNGWDATQATGANQPTLQTAEFGGQNIVRFDGSNDRLDATGAVGILNNVGGATLLAAVKYANAGNRVALVISVNGINSARANLQLSGGNYNAGGRRLDANSFQGVSSAGGTSTTRILIQTGVFDYANAVLTLFLDGSSAASSSSFQTSGNTSATNSFIVRLGGSANDFEGDIGALVVADSALNASQRKRTEHAAAFSFKIACN